MIFVKNKKTKKIKFFKILTKFHILYVISLILSYYNKSYFLLTEVHFFNELIKKIGFFDRLLRLSELIKIFIMPKKQYLKINVVVLANSKISHIELDPNKSKLKMDVVLKDVQTYAYKAKIEKDYLLIWLIRSCELEVYLWVINCLKRKKLSFYLHLKMKMYS